MNLLEIVGTITLIMLSIFSIIYMYYLGKVVLLGLIIAHADWKHRKDENSSS